MIHISGNDLKDKLVDYLKDKHSLAVKVLTYFNEIIMQEEKN